MANVQKLNFTHYGFIKENLLISEIIQVLHSMKKWRELSNLKNIAWNIDGRHIEEIKLEKYIFLNRINKDL